ncbi:MAG: glycosyltransferase family 2 protein [Pseudomonadota bacterium]
MTALTILLVSLSVLLLLPSSVLLIQVLAAMLPTKQAIPAFDPAAAVTTSPNVLLLMPAHNEANGIRVVLQTLMSQLGPKTRLLVVADNCTDDTARIAREVAGANSYIEVVERHNELLRGKGYALDHGVRHIANQPPDVLLIVDADCVVLPGSIDSLASACIAANRPVQALYLMFSPVGAGVKTRLAEFAWVVKNRVRPLGFHRLGLPCQLMGTGMAFTWKQISRIELNTGHIVEDMQLGIDLARNGAPPMFLPDALVTSEFPLSAAGLHTQRTRWEHGHLGVIVSQVPALIWQSLRGANTALLAMALDLCVPPLALLALLTAAMWVICLVLALFDGSTLPLMLASLAMGAVGAAVMLAWLRYGRKVIGLKQLCFVPLYVVAKVPLYFYFLVKRQSTWVRSKRNDEQ